MIPIEKQVITLEQAKTLKELGVEQDSLFYFINCYMNSPIDKWKIVFKDEKEKYRGICECYSAFTIGELRYMIFENIDVENAYSDVEFCLISSDALEDFNRVIKG